MEDLTRLSRVELEPRLAAELDRGTPAEAEAIRAELAARTWQNLNPYAGWAVPSSRDVELPGRSAREPGA